MKRKEGIGSEQAARIRPAETRETALDSSSEAALDKLSHVRVMLNDWVKLRNFNINFIYTYIYNYVWPKSKLKIISNKIYPNSL